jgi:hypothetical protein
MSRPRIEPGPPEREASTLEKSHLDSLFAGYSEPLLGLRLALHYVQPLHGSPQCMRGHGLDRVWPNSPLHIAMRASALSVYQGPRDADHVGVTAYRGP